MCDDHVTNWPPQTATTSTASSLEALRAAEAAIEIGWMEGGLLSYLTGAAAPPDGPWKGGLSAPLTLQVPERGGVSQLMKRQHQGRALLRPIRSHLQLISLLTVSLWLLQKGSVHSWV